MVSKSDFKSSGPRSFPGRGEYELHLTPDVNQGNKEARWVQYFGGGLEVCGIHNHRLI